MFDKFSLQDKKGLIIGVANDQSIAYGCAQVMQAQGAELAITYYNQKAEPYVRPLAAGLAAPIILPCDVQDETQIETLFTAINQRWGRIDFLLHSIAFAPAADLHGRVVDCSLAGFSKAMDISCHSFMRLARRALPLMINGGSLLTVSYYGSEKVVENYNMMGPVKAALESAVRYMASELGNQNIRVNALSPGAIMTRAANGLEKFPQLLNESKAKAPMHRLIDLADVGYMASFLASDAAKNITGGIHYIDAGYDIID